MADSNIIDSLKNGIGTVESNGNYNALGKATATGDKAYGKYQVMGANIPSWTKEATGTPATKEDFLKNPDLQEKVAHYKISQDYKKYGNAEDVASAWFSGRPLKQAGNASDVNGTTVPNYVKKVLAHSGLGNKVLGETDTASPLPEESMPSKSYSRSDVIANIDAMEQQGAKPDEVQGYLDSLNSDSSPTSSTSTTPTSTTPKKHTFDELTNLPPPQPETTEQKLAPGHAVSSLGQAGSDLLKGNFSGALGNTGVAIGSGIRDLGSTLTGGATETLSKGISGSIARGVQHVKGLLGGQDNSAYIPHNTYKETTDTLGAASRVSGIIGALATAGAASGALAQTALKNSVIEQNLGNLDVGTGQTPTMDEFMNFSKREQMNYLGDMLKNAPTGDQGYILKAMKYVDPQRVATVISKLGGIAKVAALLSTGATIDQLFGSKVGGLIKRGVSTLSN